MVIKEAQPAYTYLNLYDYQTDAIVVNRILPPAIGEQSRFLEGWRKAQSGYEGQVSVAFGDVPIFHAPLFEREVVGESMLERLGQAVFGKHDPATLFHQGDSQRVERQGSDYVLAIDLPFASKENIELT